MKLQTLLPALLFGFTTLFIPTVGAQNLSILLKNGETNSIETSILRKITFSEGNVIFSLNNGEADSYEIASINKVLLNGFPSDIDTLNSDTTAISLYIDPSGSTLYLQHAPTNTSINIYRIDGAVILRTRTNDANPSLNISHLAKGVYLLRIDRHILKFIK